MSKLKDGDFVSFDYIGILEETQEIFDLTSKEVAKDKGVFNEEADYSPAIVVVGAGHVVKGLDKNLPGLKVGETKDIIIEPQEGFGRRDGKLIKLIPLKVFIKRQIRPYPGMRVNLQGAMGRVQSVESGRVLVDFNHPLAGKKLKYTITIKEILEKPEDKIAGMLKLHSGLKTDQFEVIKEKDGFTVKVKKELPKFIEDLVSQELEKYARIKRPKFVY
jgi:FKBP-type peptidyl-prolyl cis-trans isomerase 2